MATVFNQNFVPGWNALYQNLINKVALTIITANVYRSPFSQMLQDMEIGEYVEDIHINPGAAVLQDTVINSDIFRDYFDDIVTSVYDVTVDLVFPSTYVEYVVRAGFSLLENVSELISALTANIRTTLEFWRNNLVKQMLFNGWVYGMIDEETIPDPLLSAANAGNFATTLNWLIDDFRTEINPRHVIYNNRNAVTAALAQGNDIRRWTISTEQPYVIIFNQFIRTVEFMNALNLSIAGTFRSGNNNQDWQNRLIFLNREDFPTGIPPIDREEVIFNPVPDGNPANNSILANNVNFYTMPVDRNNIAEFTMRIPRTPAIGTPGQPGFTPAVWRDIYAFIIDPRAIKLFTQLSIKTAWLNPASLHMTNREIYRGIMELGAFNKIVAITSIN